jgi:hypothetical protein
LQKYKNNFAKIQKFLSNHAQEKKAESHKDISILEQNQPAQLHAMTVFVQYRNFTDCSIKSQMEQKEESLASMDPFGQHVWHKCSGH